VARLVPPVACVAHRATAAGLARPFGGFGHSLKLTEVSSTSSATSAPETASVIAKAPPIKGFLVATSLLPPERRCVRRRSGSGCCAIVTGVPAPLAAPSATRGAPWAARRAAGPPITIIILD
jgi:hypothetical protein